MFIGFKWQSKLNTDPWSDASGINTLSGHNPVELPENAPFNQYYFRRVVYSGLNDVCVNTSRAILLKDFPVITNNIVSQTQTICSGSAPAGLTGSTPLNGNGIYTYAWQDSTKTHTWANISGATSQNFQPPALTDTTGYRRIVFSSECSDVSKRVIIKVHKPIINNIISSRFTSYRYDNLQRGYTSQNNRKKSRRWNSYSGRLCL